MLVEQQDDVLQEQQDEQEHEQELASASWPMSLISSISKVALSSSLISMSRSSMIIFPFCECRFRRCCESHAGLRRTGSGDRIPSVLTSTSSTGCRC